ncbi:MAG: Tex family protein [Eubacteriales bacterium]
MDILQTLAAELLIPNEQLQKTVELLDQGNTIPFIARYRKEVTGSLDDVALRQLADRLQYLRNMDKRRQEIAALIDAQGKLTPELTAALERARALVELEDLYRPYRPKRTTRASVAKEKGLEPLAALIAKQRAEYERPFEAEALLFIDEEKGVQTAEQALAGAADIIAEDIANQAEYRKLLRELCFREGVLLTRQAKDEDSVYANYYDFSEPVAKLRPHRILAINRGEKEGFLKVTLELDEAKALALLAARVITCPASPAARFLSETMTDSYRRLIFPSLEREVRTELFEDAAEGALRVFADNLRKLLLAAPLKGKTVMGYDPGYRTGCKLCVVDKTGRVLETAVIYPTKPREDIRGSRTVLLRLIKTHQVDVIAIGNGTASRESELFIAELLKAYPELDVKYTIVSEAGASVYSASELGTEEFPDFDVTERSAVSIARRLQDPLAELVKIDPKAIGVGQYQHDMKQARLNETLAGVVEGCVNSVGVDLNTASYSLLSYIAGINATAAKNIVAYREEAGEFTDRVQLLKVKKIGAKAYEQCAGFLRIPGAKEPLDNTGVHPESYPIAKALLAKFGYTDADMLASKLTLLPFDIEKYGIRKLCAELGCGEPTLRDMVEELLKPGRDIRDAAPAPNLRTDVLDMADLKEGMLLTGTVRNVVDFGAFVDIGVHQDGLLHVSEMSDRFIRHPNELLSVGDVIEVRVKGVDLEKKRISLTRKNMK